MGAAIRASETQAAGPDGQRGRAAGAPGRAPPPGAGARSATVADVVADLIGLHGTDPASVYLAAWARTSGVDRAAIEDALYAERALVRMLGMRRTVFVVPPPSCRWSSPPAPTRSPNGYAGS